MSCDHSIGAGISGGMGGGIGISPLALACGASSGSFNATIPLGERGHTNKEVFFIAFAKPTDVLTEKIDSYKTKCIKLSGANKNGGVDCFNALLCYEIQQGFLKNYNTQNRNINVSLLLPSYVGHELNQYKYNAIAIVEYTNNATGKANSENSKVCQITLCGLVDFVHIATGESTVIQYICNSFRITRVVEGQTGDEAGKNELTYQSSAVSTAISK